MRTALIYRPQTEWQRCAMDINRRIWRVGTELLNRGIPRYLVVNVALYMFFRDSGLTEPVEEFDDWCDMLKYRLDFSLAEAAEFSKYDWRYLEEARKQRRTNRPLLGASASTSEYRGTPTDPEDE